MSLQLMNALFYGSLVLVFVLGGVMCAFLVDSTKFKVSRQYGWALVIIGGLIAISAGSCSTTTTIHRLCLLEAYGQFHASDYRICSKFITIR
jgi:uncharacterized membrane protein HdeD (DUF308 family)